MPSVSSQSGVDRATLYVLRGIPSTEFEFSTRFFGCPCPGRSPFSQPRSNGGSSTCQLPPLPRAARQLPSNAPPRHQGCPQRAFWHRRRRGPARFRQQKATTISSGYLLSDIPPPRSLSSSDPPHTRCGSWPRDTNRHVAAGRDETNRDVAARCNMHPGNDTTTHCRFPTSKELPTSIELFINGIIV